MVAKKYQNKSGGLNQAGRDYFKRTEGSNLKAPVKSGTPTRKALALKKWGFGSVEAARNFANRHKKKKRTMVG